MECICGKTKEFRIGSNEFFIGTLKIIIHNLPHYFCSRCNKESYGGVSVDDALKYAYESNASELDWQRYLDYAYAYEKGVVIGVLMVIRRMLDSGLKIDEVAKYTDYSPDELEQLLHDNAVLVKERIQLRRQQRQAREANAFEDDFPDGVFVAPSDEPKVKLRKMLNYCREVGKIPSELTPEELEPFLEKKE